MVHRVSVIAARLTRRRGRPWTDGPDPTRERRPTGARAYAATAWVVGASAASNGASVTVRPVPVHCWAIARVWLGTERPAAGSDVRRPSRLVKDRMLDVPPTYPHGHGRGRKAFAHLHATGEVTFFRTLYTRFVRITATTSQARTAKRTVAYC